MKISFRSFYTKLSAMFLGLIVIMGTIQTVLTIRITDMRQIEADQIVNYDLASSMAVEIAPYLKEDIDLAGIESAIHYMMVMNPTIEIYLLDSEGTILAFFAEPGKEVKQRSVDLEPIKRFLHGEKRMPIYGDDPRHPDQKKHFSVALLSIGDGSAGYLYVVLRSSLYDRASSTLKERYFLSALFKGLIFSFISVALVGLLLFALLTKRLQRVSTYVSEFGKGNYDQRIDIHSKDEIGHLASAFNQMADTIVENIKKLKQKDMLRRELSANISHDLRSPLASIEGYIETILMKEESIERKERKKYLHVTLENLKLLNGLVEELFELSNLDAKQVRPKIESFSLTELTQDVNMKLKPRANDLEVDLVPRVPEKLYFVKADIGMIERVMTNLLDNALKYSPAGSSVIVRIDKRNEQVRYSVSDSGPGISEEDLPFIFDRYFTGTRGHGRGRGGSGLGLAISKKILELHGSMIRVNCGKEKGCTFYFELPVLPSNP